MNRSMLPTAAVVLLGAGLVTTQVLAGTGRRRVDEGARGYPRALSPGARTRTWVHPVERKPVVFPRRGSGGDAGLLNPIKVRARADGRVLVLDFGDRSVKEYAPDGRFLRKYGRGKGQGPGEMMNPTDFGVGPNGEVWVLDPGQARIQVFAESGEPARTLSVPVPAARFALFADGHYTALGNNDWLFHRFRADGSAVGPFGRLVPDQLENAIVLQGETNATPDGGVIYAPLWGGYLARFTPEGGLAFYRHTIDPRPYGVVDLLKGGATTVSKESRESPSTVGASVAGDEIFLLTGAQYQGHRRGTIDVYSLRDGTYRYSFLSPAHGPRAIHVTDRWVYVVGDTLVSRWPRRPVQ